jgi:hypothetical protein
MSYLPFKSFQVTVDHDANLDNYRVKSQIGTVTFRHTIQLPWDLKGLISVKLVGNISAGAAQAARDIDRYVSAHQIGEVVNQKSASDTTTLFDLSTFSNKTYGFEFSNLIPAPTAGDIVGLQQDHNAIGGTIYYFQIQGIYY